MYKVPVMLTKSNAKLQLKSSLLFVFWTSNTLFDSLAAIPVSHLESKATYSLTAWIFNLNLFYCTPVIFTSIYCSDRILHYKLGYSSL